MCTLLLKQTQEHNHPTYFTYLELMTLHYRVEKPGWSPGKTLQKTFDHTVLCAAHTVERPCCNGDDFFPLQTLNLSRPSDMVIRAVTQTVIIPLSPEDDTTLTYNWPSPRNIVEHVTVLLHFTYQVYTAPDFVKATENCEPHSTLITPSPVRESIWKQKTQIIKYHICHDITEWDVPSGHGFPSHTVQGE